MLDSLVGDTDSSCSKTYTVQELNSELAWGFQLKVKGRGFINSKVPKTLHFTPNPFETLRVSKD
jgi:hypothetical protein